MGTGGALYNLKKRKINDFVLLNGDTIFDIDLKLLFKSMKKNTVDANIIAVANQKVIPT